MAIKTIQLQSVLVPAAGLKDFPELYYHIKENRIDYDGYFNLFYIEKRKRYTRIGNLKLHIWLRGYKELILVHDGKDLMVHSLEQDRLREYDIEFPYEDHSTGCFWFALKKDMDAGNCILKGFFETSLEMEKIREVNIGIDICTYRREEYVARNLRQLKEKILDRDELQVSSHVKIHIIDNGETLNGCGEVQSLAAECGGKVRIFPNKNTGGAGGFTRGMLEIVKAKEKERFTHVLLMDDDAAAEPDAFVRVYGLAATLKEEWRDITIGGAMLREDHPYILFCAGESWKEGRISVPEMHLDLREYRQASDRYLTGTEGELEMYSGWWFCCYSLRTVRKDNLPLPLFLHHDDIEFGLRNRRHGIVFLNGICVWHRGAELTFPGSNIYYDTRNNLIETALHQKAGKRITAMKIVFRAIISSVIRLKYKDRDMVWKALTDYRKGPGWLYRKDADELNREVRAMAYAMIPVEAMREQLTQPEYDRIMDQIKKFQETFSMDRIEAHRKGKTKATLLHYLTLNGWFLPGEDGIKVITPLDSPYDVFRKKRVLLYEPGTGKGVLLERKYIELLKSLAVCAGAGVLLIGFPYTKWFSRSTVKQIGSQKAWERYLRI